ncbi:redox-active disulfide protein 2 [Aquimarina gracilis]|uniref:Redox-active disulfide protein 2 n=1 Tax=Aquimarina gracilis TaxID=874422 RepID=A0ABU5ZYJ6_9FLAO|nr:redox-active disulfide protein 2 [Aquimarina gracilis]MEB3346890.1 redox-active disulfide protein 2 [Aquimarina gracilis]
MKKNDIKSKSSEKLQSELKVIKAITGTLIGTLILLFALVFYGLFATDKKGVFIPLLMVAISCSAILPLQFISMKKIKAELDSRENS